jgi:hypothetical protein
MTLVTCHDLGRRILSLLNLEVGAEFELATLRDGSVLIRKGDSLP